jgi:4-amino-4-deoxy-L-arabinose transferase-like glycosyltransferase
MAAPFEHRGGHYLILIASALLLFFWNLGSPSLWEVDEGRNAACALEMLESGNWIVPTYNGLLRSDKPVLLYWLQAAAYRVLGVHEGAARLPSALAALGAVLLAYELGRTLFGKTTGLLGGLMAASTPMLIVAGRFANPDALLHFFTLLTMLIFWRGQRQPGAGWWLALGAVAGLGMLSKGPVAVVVPALVGLLFFLWEGRWRVLVDGRLVWGTLTFLAVAGPWYIWVAIETKGRFWRGFFLQHNVERFLDSMEGHGGTPLYYVIVLFAGLAPWSIFLSGACWHAFWSARSEPSGRGHAVWERWADTRRESSVEQATSLLQRRLEACSTASVYRFLLCWIAVYVAFFSVAATKLPNYVLPAVVPCALLTARLLERWRAGALVLPRWFFPVGLALWLTFGVVVAAGLTIAGGVIEVPALRGRVIPGLGVLAWLGGAPLLGALAGWRLLKQQRRGAMVACLAGAAVVGAAPLAAWAQAAVNHVKAVQPLVQETAALDRTRDLRIVACQVGHLASLNFYAQRDVIHIDAVEQVPGYLHYPLPVFVFLPAPAWEECRTRHPGLGRELARQRDLYSGRDIVVVTNR